MNLGLVLLRLATCPPMRVFGLRWLFSVTAAGFDLPLPRRSWRHGRLLQQYAEFTAAAAREALAHADGGDAAWARLRRAAYAAGDELRRRLRLRSPDEAMAAAALLYRCVGIDFAGQADGGIEVASCYFSRRYDPATCRFMAAVDEGIVAGLHGGGRLTFGQRITDGSACCRARLSRPGEAKDE